MVTLPLLSPVKNLSLLARQVVEGFLIGLHKSPFHGFSVEFAEHRLYNPGDPLKYVDWKVYGRSDRMFTKKFEEETNLRCCLALDTSSSMHYPQTGVTNLTLTLRTHLKRLNRRTLCFSKSLFILIAVLRIYFWL